MKQLLFLLLFPSLALAQYQGNANQKITLGEQTTADGLVWRGITTDTVNLMTNKLDTSAYLVLDTITEAIWLYRASTTPKWNRVVDSLNNLQGQLSLTTKVTGVLPVANGGTGSATQNFVDLTTTQSSIAGAKTFTSAVTATRFNPTANTVTGNGMFLPAANTLGFSTNNLQRIHINSAGKVGLGTQMTTIGTNDYGLLNVKGFLSFQEQFLAYRSSGVQADGYAYFYLRNAGAPGSFGTGLTGQFEFTTYSINNDINAFVIGNNQQKPFIIVTNATEKMRVQGDGEVNIGFGATDNGAYPLQVNGQIFATNATIATSDEKFKENITPLNKGLEIVNKLKPVTFNFISDTENNFSEYEEVGFIAQDVDRALSTETFSKSIVKAADDSEPTSTMGLATQNLIPILVKAIQEQTIIIKQLEDRILILENK